ncbi:MAG TPA: hypothetical protein VN805_01640 [Caulobacteraceae bacterium]|nr:hypothetical protein [Caulobacteraceae bacterium]
MKLSDTPDLTSNRRLVAVGLAITLGAWVVLAISEGNITTSLGDTDDAMRLVLVRSLLHGQGWYDQLVTRLQPPQGIYMHWSRLLDGALAGFLWLVERVTTPAWAELIVRFTWPLLWIAPAAIAALSIARSLGGKLALFCCAMLLLTNTQMYVQFRPGRIDHHNVQITMAAIAVACAMAREQRTRFAALAGFASGLGLAIGIEALAFHALAGASFALSAVIDRDEAKAARAYGLALAAATTGFFLLQTPPDRWGLPFCDSLGFNLTAAILIAGLGLAAFGAWGVRASLPFRLAQAAAIGLATGAVYLAIDPACIHGPFAAVDPRLRPIWFVHISELQPWERLWFQHRDSALISIFMALMGAAAALTLLAVRWRRWDRATLLAAALVLVAAVSASRAWRMEDYAFWFGVPALAAALGWLAERLWRGVMVPTALVSVALSPVPLAVGADAALTAIAKAEPAHAHAAQAAPKPAIDQTCFDVALYRPLAVLPPGVVLGEIDLGPHVLAHTSDSVITAPYHRMSWGILRGYEALGAPTALARAQLKALNVTYILDCRLDGLKVNPAGFEGDLRRGRIPPWVRPLSQPGDPMQIYRVTP